jgi:peptide/nickel transport system substrate-binding protein
MKRLLSVSISAILLATTLSACSGGATVVPNSHVTVAEIGTVATWNADATSDSYADDYAMLASQDFYQLNSNGDLVANKEFGTIKVDGNKVTYTMGKNAVWSDGAVVDSTDLALAVYAATNSEFASEHGTSTLANAQIVGTPKPGENTLTIQFPAPIADWKTALRINVPAHIVGKAAGLGGNTATVRAGIIDAFKQNKTDVISKLAKSYVDAFGPKADAGNFVTNGAYTVSKASETGLTLKAVTDFAGTYKPIAETVNLSFFATNADAFAAVAKGAVDVFSPTETLTEPQSDLVTAAGGLDTSKVTLVAPSSNLTEQFVLNLGSGFFADSSYADKNTAAVLRLAFQNMIPKARAIDFASLTQTVTRSDSFVFGAGSKNYAATIGSNGSAQFAFQDVERASELIKPQGLSRWATIKVLFDADSPAAVAEWTMLVDHASNAGVRLANISSSDPSIRLKSGDYDVYLGALPLLGSGSGSIEQLKTGPSRMPDETYSSVTKEVLAASDKTLPKMLSVMDKVLFDLGYGLPIYQLPTLTVYNNRIKNFTPDPFGNTSTWGYWTWNVSADK